MSDLKQQIIDTAAGPAEAANDASRVRAQPIKDLITADEYLSRKKLARKPLGGVRVARVISPSP